jgi:hypothetical protein
MDDFTASILLDTQHFLLSHIRALVTSDYSQRAHSTRFRKLAHSLILNCSVDPMHICFCLTNRYPQISQTHDSQWLTHSTSIFSIVIECVDAYA